MQLSLFFIETHKNRIAREWHDEYEKRINLFNRFSIEGVKAEASSAMSETEIMKYEEKLLRSHLKKGDFLICLDRKGKHLSSLDFSRSLERWQLSGNRRICFIIGGAYGLSQQILDQSDFILSLSQMTIQHDLARIILLEQLYRAFTIMKKLPYHK